MGRYIKMNKFHSSNGKLGTMYWEYFKGCIKYRLNLHCIKTDITSLVIKSSLESKSWWQEMFFVVCFYIYDLYCKF